MGQKSGIAWTNGTFNPWWGCVKISPACDRCYAESTDARFSDESHWGQDAPRRTFGDKHWNEPLAWNRKAEKFGERFLVFCASMADVFESRDDLDEHRTRLWKLIEATPALTWLLLTKRPQNIRRMLPLSLVGARHIWLGTTIESPEYLWRAHKLCDLTHAAVRFASMEPLLAETPMSRDLARGIDWIITGCESGDGARDTPTDWYRRLRDECSSAGVPFFLKQAPRDQDGIGQAASSFVKRDLRTGPDGMKRATYLVEMPTLDGVQHVAFPRSP